MAKLLDKKEAVEIINTLLEEYGIEPPHLVFEEEYGTGYWSLYKQETGSFRFWKWVWNYKYKNKDPWTRSSTLEEVVTAIEYDMSRLDVRVDKATKIRERHATRLLEQKLTE